MHKVFLKYSVQLDFFVFFVTIFSLPFGKSIFVPILFGWLCAVFLSYFVKRDYSNDRFKGILLLPVLFYLLHLIGVLFSTNLKGGFFDMQMKLSILLLPLLYPYQRESYREGKIAFLWSFVAGCSAASIYYISYAIFRSYTLVDGVWIFNPLTANGWYNHFLSVEFSYLIHPSYLALYILVALLIIGVELNRWWKKGFTIKIVVILTAILLLASLIMLQSRAGILSFGLLAFVWISYLVLAKRRYLLGSGILVALFLLAFFVFTRFDRISNTAKSLETTSEVGIKNQNKEDATAVRFWIWKSAFSLIQEHPILGVGTGDVRDEMQKSFERLGMVNAARERLNAHNQYLETWLDVGIFGLLALLSMLLVPLWMGIKKHDWLLVGFVCLCSVSFFFESMLETIAGIAFFALFYTILVTRYYTLRKTTD